MVFNLITGVYPYDGALSYIQKTRLPSVVGKWAIEATKPVAYREEEKNNYERARPIGWREADLKYYLD